MRTKLFFRWLSLNKWELLASVAVVISSIIVVTEPNFIAGGLNALRIPYAVFLTLYTIFFFIRNNKLMLSGGVIACLILFPGIWRYFRPGQVPENERLTEQRMDKIARQADFSMAHFNVKENNKFLDRLLADALAADADILSMQEIKPESFPQIDSTLRTHYPYSHVSLDYTGFGLALYSKFPITWDSTHVLYDQFPILTGHIQVAESTISYICVTTSTPTSEKGFEQQAKQFHVIGLLAKQETLPLVLAGDLNTVPWSSSMETLLEKTGLKDSRKDLAATFPSQSILVQIPIDYILHNRLLECAEFSTLSKSSSNHLGIIGYYNLK
jgi:endonuclease/exonuclease/phosphatase (EEP) superfamily protein YafD